MVTDLEEVDVVGTVVVVVDKVVDVDIIGSTILWFLTFMMANFSFIPGSTKNFGVKSCISFSSSNASCGSWNCLPLVGLNFFFTGVDGVGWKLKLVLESSSTVVVVVG